MQVIPVYGSISSIGANNVGIIAEFKVPNGKYAEVFEVGVIPDYDPSTGASNLLGVSFAKSNEEGSIGTVFEHCNISANHNGKNAAPYGDRASKQPALVIDTPGVPGNLTYKYDGGKVVQLLGKAGASATGTVRGRFTAVVYEPYEIEAIFGVPPDEFTSLPGGYNQKVPVLPYYEYIYNASATGGTGSWEDIKQINVQAFEEITFREIGVAPNENSQNFRIYDEGASKYFPALDNYPFRITEAENELPFGDDDDFQPRKVVPEDLLTHVFNNTTIHLEVKDTGTAIPANGLCLQIVGEYRKVR